MRNFSYVFEAFGNYQSYNIGCGEYVLNPSEVFDDVVKAIARALEVSIAGTRVVIRMMLCDDNWENEPAMMRFSASELEVLSKLAAFYRKLERQGNLGILDGGSTQTFVYHNLNTGKSVVWTHMVC